MYFRYLIRNKYLKTMKLNSRNASNKIRIYHRYLGFFLAGIMLVYGLSGIIMVYRNTNTFKKVTQVEKTIEPNLKGEQLGPILRTKVSVNKTEGSIIYFNKTGTYNVTTGAVSYEKAELPYLLDKIEHMHKATVDSPLYYFNIFFGISLMFFALSSFWMFMPSTSVFKKGLYFSLAGAVLLIIMVFV